MLAARLLQCLLGNIWFQIAGHALCTLATMLAVSYTFDASFKLYCLHACSKWLLFLLHLTPACRQCYLHACYNACCFLYIWCHLASNALCTLATMLAVSYSLYASLLATPSVWIHTMQQLAIGYNLCLIQSVYEEVWALSQKGRKEHSNVKSNHHRKLAVCVISKNVHVANLQQ